MQGTYDGLLVALSLMIGVLASYTALDLASRIARSQPRSARYWLLGGALAMGSGIWSMHFVGMLALSMPIPLAYDILLTLASLLAAVVCSGLALYLASRASMSTRQLLAGGLIIGVGICAMHYLGMAAMRMSPPIQYDKPLFGASVLIAMAASIAALHLAFTLRASTGAGLIRRRAIAALVMGAGISGMHYTGMAAAQFAPDSMGMVSNGLSLNNESLDYMIGFAMLGILTSAMIASIFDAQLSSQSHRLLAEVERSNRELKREVEERSRAEDALRLSESLFRMAFDNAPIGMVLYTAEAEWLRVNPAMCRMLGYDAQELAERSYAGCVHPDDDLPGRRAYAQAVSAGQSAAQVELRFMHKQGHVVPVRVHVTTAPLLQQGRQTFIAQIEDISEQRQQNERIVRLSRVHALLSGVSSSIVRIRDREELLKQACHIAVAQGGFVFARAGQVDGTGEITPIAQDGTEKGYLEEIRAAMEASGNRREGPTTVMVSEKRIVVCNDIATDPPMTRWRDFALQRGYRSMIAIPLSVDDRIVACLDLYSDQPNYFDAEEVSLLTGLAADLSYALAFISHEQEIDYLSYYDSLTGLANRRLFLERVNTHLQAAKRSGRKIAVSIVDLDRFKAINDAWGSSVGDNVLTAIAERMVEFARNPACLSRVSGDRYALIETEVSDTASLMKQLREDLLSSICEPLVVFGQELRISARAGVAIFPLDGEDAESLLRNAESALKDAKRSGDALCAYTQQLSASVRQRMEMDNRLRRAIDRGEFQLHYQPKLDLNTDRVCGVEALLRWESPELGFVPPKDFVPLLEETGLIQKVGLWVIEEALRTYRQWSQLRGCAAPRIAVNVSPLQFKQADFIEQFTRRLVAAGSPCGLDIEVTESLMLANVDANMTRLNRLRELGVRIAIDDFGTGYSSLAQLARLPVDALKIDRSFIIRMGENAASVSLVETIIQMAHSLNLRTIAEGVDSFEQLRLLQMLRCDEVQGFLFSRAVPFARLDGVVNSLRSPRSSTDALEHPRHLRSTSSVG